MPPTGMPYLIQDKTRRSLDNTRRLQDKTHRSRDNPGASPQFPGQGDLGFRSLQNNSSLRSCQAAPLPA